MRNLIKKIIHPFFKTGMNIYFSKPRNYSYGDISVTVQPGVFPPHLTISTKILLDYLDTEDLENKKILELGCGSGIISLFAASNGAIVTASDINKVAIEAIEMASEKNNLKIKAIYSDLFDQLNNLSFDYIIINPPYYPKEPKNIKEKAWYCGENFEYFEKLFYQLPQYIQQNNYILMILSEDCDIDYIQSIALKNHILFQLIKEQKVVNEQNFIFKIVLDEKVV
ncbi:methyltransferase [Aquimarina sp. 2201CG14-23]|uniref:methyltransferase n=1 Tax=Aquimarina mycalae TaxID=3040073 RepID=UPI002477DA8F|nr:methyltransferase [Aquimarina sp. 2201CG14-23]MDH7448043.1 methyltransferase [Aquimarina sp. 2201CG14-23]